MANKNMTIPTWIAANYAEISEQLNESHRSDFDDAWEHYTAIYKLLKKLPEEQIHAEIRQRSPDFFSRLDIHPWLALLTILEGGISKLSSTHFYKTKALFEGLEHSLNTGNFLVAISLVRSTLEESCFQHYVLIRMEKFFQKSSKLLQMQAKNIKRGKTPPINWSTKFITTQLDMITLLDRAAFGSDFKWKEHWSKDGSESPHIEAEYKKRHVMDVIEDADKKTGISFVGFYNLLSEMTHPNFGSNTLMIRTRKNPENPAGDVDFAQGQHNRTCRVFL